MRDWNSMCRAPAQHRNSGSTCWPFHCEQSCSAPSCMPSAVPRTCYAARVIASRCRHAAVSLHPSWPEWKLPFRLSPIPPRACLPQRKTRPCRLRLRNDDSHRPYSSRLRALSRHRTPNMRSVLCLTSPHTTYEPPLTVVACAASTTPGSPAPSRSI